MLCVLAEIRCQSRQVCAVRPNCSMQALLSAVVAKWAPALDI